MPSSFIYNKSSLNSCLSDNNIEHENEFLYSEWCRSLQTSPAVFQNFAGRSAFVLKRLF